MKKFRFIIIVLLFTSVFSSCQTYQLTDREAEAKTFGIDFRSYNDKGFLFMPDEYYGEYEVLGIIRAELHPRVEYRLGSFPSGTGYIAHKFRIPDGRRYTQLSHLVNIDELIEHIYELATEWGGDAFTHFETDVKTSRTDDDPNTSYAYYTISGIVIKRN